MLFFLIRKLIFWHISWYFKLKKWSRRGSNPRPLHFFCAISTMLYLLSYRAITFLYHLFVFHSILINFLFLWKNVSVEIPLINTILLIFEDVKMCYLKKRKKWNPKQTLLSFFPQISKFFKNSKNTKQKKVKNNFCFLKEKFNPDFLQ